MFVFTTVRVVLMGEVWCGVNLGFTVYLKYTLWVCVHTGGGGVSFRDPWFQTVNEAKVSVSVSQ